MVKIFSPHNKPNPKIMAQIIKHRRGGIAALKDVTARVGEFVMATGSIANLNGPMVFIGESEGVAGEAPESREQDE
jgi:hypothetical protein